MSLAVLSASVPVPEPLMPATVCGWQAHRAVAYLDVLLGDAQRKNGWQLAETVGDATRYGLQHLLGRAVWLTHAAREAL